MGALRDAVAKDPAQQVTRLVHFLLELPVLVSALAMHYIRTESVRALHEFVDAPALVRRLPKVVGDRRGNPLRHPRTYPSGNNSASIAIQ